MPGGGGDFAREREEIFIFEGGETKENDVFWGSRGHAFLYLYLWVGMWRGWVGGCCWKAVFIREATRKSKDLEVRLKFRDTFSYFRKGMSWASRQKTLNELSDM